MTAYSDLDLLLGAYFHQDYFEVTGDEVVDMLNSDRERYASLVDEYGISLGDAS